MIEEQSMKEFKEITDRLRKLPEHEVLRIACLREEYDKTREAAITVILLKALEEPEKQKHLIGSLLGTAHDMWDEEEARLDIITGLTVSRYHLEPETQEQVLDSMYELAKHEDGDRSSLGVRLRAISYLYYTTKTDMVVTKQQLEDSTKPKKNPNICVKIVQPSETRISP